MVNSLTNTTTHEIRVTATRAKETCQTLEKTEATTNCILILERQQTEVHSKPRMGTLLRLLVTRIMDSISTMVVRTVGPALLSQCTTGTSRTVKHRLTDEDRHHSNIPVEEDEECPLLAVACLPVGEEATQDHRTAA